ncbi:ankyrin repeat protein, partial [Phyllosticta capitalensis]
EILRLLLYAGADPNTQDYGGYTLMHLAIDYANIDELVKMLLDKGADINMKNNWGETPLYGAAARGYEESVRALLNGNADPTVKMTSGETALEIAKRKCRKEITKVL